MDLSERLLHGLSGGCFERILTLHDLRISIVLNISHWILPLVRIPHYRILFIVEISPSIVSGLWHRSCQKTGEILAFMSVFSRFCEEQFGYKVSANNGFFLKYLGGVHTMGYYLHANRRLVQCPVESQ